MIRSLTIGLTIAFAWAVAPSPASEPGPERPGTPPRAESREGNRPEPTAAQGRPTPAGPDFKVVFWFDGLTPKHRVYDVRRGQYTKAVEVWVRRHQRQRIDEFGFVHPGAMAIVRDISPQDEPGRTDQEKLEAGVARASRAVYAADPADLSRLLQGYARDSRFARKPPDSGSRRPPRLLPGVGPGRSGDRSYLDYPQPYPSPVPYPYPRPHP
jgi:hypothetical protein